MVTAASINVKARGYFFTSGITTFARNMVDTIGGSTWYCSGFDGSAGSNFSGGSAAALAGDDVSAVATDTTTIRAELSGAAGIATFPAGVMAANGVSIAEVLRLTQENIIRGTGTILPDNTSLFGVLAGASGVTTYPVGAVAADGVSMAEVLRYAQENVNNGGTILPAGDSLWGALGGASGFGAFPASAAPANGVSLAEGAREQYDQADKAVTNTTAVITSGGTIFTIAGGPIEILSLVARCVSANGVGAQTLQWSADPTDGAAATFSGASADVASVAAGAMVVLIGTTLATAPGVATTGVTLGQQVTNGIVVGAGIITTTYTGGPSTGTWQHHLRYRPLSRGVTVA